MVETSIVQIFQNMSTSIHILHFLFHFKTIIKKQGLYNHLPASNRPWESISIDCMYVLPSTKHDNECVFMVIDQFFKMEIFSAYKKSTTAKSTTNLFFEHVWVHLDLPRTITLDQYNRFLSTDRWTPI